MRRSKPLETVLLEPLQRVAVDLQRQVGDALVGAHLRPKPSDRPASDAMRLPPDRSAPRAPAATPGGRLASGAGMLEALGFFALMEVAGLAAAPLAALVLRPAARRGPGLRQAVRAAARRLAGLDGGEPRRRGLRPRDDRRRARARGARRRARGAGGCARSRSGCETGRSRGAGSRRWRRPRLAARALPADDPERLRLLGRLGGRVRGRVRRDGAADRVRARRLEHREADGRDADERDPASRRASRRPTRGWRGRRSTTTTSATCCWRCPRTCSPSSRAPATTSRSPGCSRSPRRRSSRSPGRCGRPRARRAGRGRVRSGPASPRSRSCLVLGDLAGAREWLDADNPPGGYDWFGVSRVIQDTINEFPAFSFKLGDLHAHLLAIPFTLLALGVRAAGRARRPARRRRAGARSPRRWPPGSPSARCTRSTRGRIRSPRGCW